MRGVSDVGVRPRWRDVLALAVLGAVLVAGLVHYGRALGADEPATQGVTTTPPSGAPSAGAGDPSSAAASPTGDPTAQLEGGTPTTPGTPPDPHGGTCWDGRETASLQLCGLPDGVRGLEWVFPSFARDRAECHKAAPNADSYPVRESYECFQRALGEPVTITYDQVEDPAQVERWLVARVGEEHRHDIPGAHGGRCVFTDGTARPARITGMYERFPYVVSVYSDSALAAARAWRTLVTQRPPQKVRGVRNLG